MKKRPKDKYNVSSTESIVLAPGEIDTLIRETKKNAQLEILNWVMTKCGELKVNKMRELAHKKFLEVVGIEESDKD